MFEVIIPFGIVLLILFLFIAYASKAGGKMIKERQARVTRAEFGKAKILEYNMVGLRGTGGGAAGEYQAYRFTLEVSNEFKTPYKTTTVWEVFPMAVPSLQVGNEVNVRIDADDPNIIYPNIQSVNYSWNGAIIEAGHKK